jgi:hypothetical protein
VPEGDKLFERSAAAKFLPVHKFYLAVNNLRPSPSNDILVMPTQSNFFEDV